MYVQEVGVGLGEGEGGEEGVGEGSVDDGYGCGLEEEGVDEVFAFGRGQLEEGGKGRGITDGTSATCYDDSTLGCRGGEEVPV